MRCLLRNLRGVALIVAALAHPATSLASQTAATAAAQAGDPAELVKQAGMLSAEGKQDEALALYARALERAPDSFDAHLGAGVARDLRGDYPEARKHFAKAIELAAEGGKSQALTAMGVSYAFDRDVRNPPVLPTGLRSGDHGVGFRRCRRCRCARGVYLESGDVENALKWAQTATKQPGARAVCQGRADLWALQFAHAQARILPPGAMRVPRGEQARSRSAARQRHQPTNRFVPVWPAISTSI
jgi:tetratricopeptide (TPR) repeat protein